VLPRSFYARDGRVVAPELLNKVLVRGSRRGRIVEVEAYAGSEDPASHGFRGPSPRNEVMFGPAGHLYVYFTYGMHHCTNIVCGPEGTASALLLRAGEIVDGVELARHRRTTSKSPADLARGPARLAKALGLTTADSGRDALAPPFRLVLPSGPAGPVSSGPRVGVSGAGGTDRYSWRFWITGDPTVSQYKAAKPRGAKPDPATFRGR
jgi:DNA-3-methyladenine glycosylase